MDKDKIIQETLFRIGCILIKQVRNPGRTKMIIKLITPIISNLIQQNETIKEDISISKDKIINKE